MLKIISTMMVIFAILSYPLALPLAAQSQPPEPVASTEQTQSNSPDLKKVIAENDRKFNTRSAETEIRELTKIERQAPQNSGFTKKQKVWLIVGGVALAVLIFVLVKYGKDCIRSEPAGCTPGVDEFCYCQEYEKS